MGTSKSGTGPGPGVPLTPPWVPDAVPAAPPADGDGDGTDGADGQNGLAGPKLHIWAFEETVHEHSGTRIL
jgi:hypothetical protein